MEYDRTPLPDVFRIARTLSPDTMELWGRAIRAMLPQAPAVARVVDLGCGTARFTRLLADALGASVVGVEPSSRMLVQREVRDDRIARFVAGTAEALPLADASVDMVFASMVYHHLRPAEALTEARRVLRPGGHLMLRTPIRESLAGLPFFKCFPEALTIDEARMPSCRELIEACEAAGFASSSHEVIHQRFADDPDDYYRKISLRGLSSLQMISDDTFARGLRDFAAYCRSAPPGEPIYETVELFLFSRS